jgi:hypothetical protein
MDSGICSNRLNQYTTFEHDCREPREVGPDARAQEWHANREEYFARIQAFIADGFERLL